MSLTQRSMSRPLSTYSRSSPRQGHPANNDETTLPATALSSTSTVSEHFSSFVSLAAKVFENEIAQGSDNQANFLRNMRDHDLGLWNGSTRPVGRGVTFVVRRFVSSEEDDEGAIDGRIACKSLLLAYSIEQSKAAEKEKLSSALLELRILSHQRVLACENIVRLLGIGWESDAVIFEKKWPALLVEYADRGTLADLFESESEVPPTLKWHFCLDVACALQVLHSLRVVHGDIKLLNVLLYTNPLAQDGEEGRTIVAKLADFGGALLDMHTLTRLPSGTFPWNAPESARLMQRDQLLQTDIYSFGLLVWQVFLDGKNPFKDPNAGVYAHALTEKEIETEKNETQFYQKVRNSVRHYLTTSQTTGFDEIINLFDYSVRLEPPQRSLVQVLRVLEGNPITRVRMNVNLERHQVDEELLSGNQPASYSFGGMSFSRYINPYIFDIWRETAQVQTNPILRSEAISALAIGNLTGSDLQLDPNINEGLSFLIQSAKEGSEHRSLLLRFHEAYGRPLPADIRPLVVGWLSEAVQEGKFTAKEDLASLQEIHVLHEACERLRTRYCGIGEQRFSDDILSMFVETPPNRLEHLLRSTPTSNMNEWNDTLLHVAVTTGRLEAVRFILDREVEAAFDINIANSKNETPLLYAARCGHTSIVSILLEYHADPSILNMYGESPLHYLTSFSDNDLPEISHRLISHGGNVHAIARKQQYNTFFDYDPEYGTPLHFAVERNNVCATRCLLQHGADLNSTVTHANMYSPLALAANLHYPEVLKALIDHRRSVSDTDDLSIDPATGRSLLEFAIRGGGSGRMSSVWTKIERHGRFWKQRAQDTLEVLFESGATRHLNDLPGREFCTALFYAVRDEDHVVNAILQRDKRALNMHARVLETDEVRLPLFEAILYHRPGPFNSMRHYGMDLASHIKYEGDPVTALYYCAFARHQDTTMARAILDAGIGIDDTPDGVETPFVCAVRNRAFHLASFYLENGANPHVLFQRGMFYMRSIPKSLLGSLIEETAPAMLSCLNFLLANVADLRYATVAGGDWTVMHDIAGLDPWVSKDPTTRIVLNRLVEYFRPTPKQLDQRAVVTENSRTALHVAAYFANYEVAKRLVENGANTSLVDEWGFTPLDTAFIRMATPVTDDDFEDVPKARWIQEGEIKEGRKDMYEYLLSHTSTGVNFGVVASALGADTE